QLPEEIEVALFRVLQESLTNAAKYAQASRLRVSLECEPPQCRLEIEDNGNGFQPEEVRSSAQGLFGMRQRTETHGGNLVVRSAPGEGTVIRASLPLPGVPQVPSRDRQTALTIVPSPADAHGFGGA